MPRALPGERWRVRIVKVNRTAVWGRGEELLLPCSMLRAQEDVFLDDITLRDVEQALGKPVRVVRNNGESLIRALWNMEDVNG